MNWNQWLDNKELWTTTEGAFQGLSEFLDALEKCYSGNAIEELQPLLFALQLESNDPPSVLAKVHEMAQKSMKQRLELRSNELGLKDWDTLKRLVRELQHLWNEWKQLYPDEEAPLQDKIRTGEAVRARQAAMEDLKGDPSLLEMVCIPTWISNPDRSPGFLDLSTLEEIQNCFPRWLKEESEMGRLSLEEIRWELDGPLKEILGGYLDEKGGGEILDQLAGIFTGFREKLMEFHLIYRESTDYLLKGLPAFLKEKPYDYYPMAPDALGEVEACRKPVKEDPINGEDGDEEGFGDIFSDSVEVSESTLTPELREKFLNQMAFDIGMMKVTLYLIKIGYLDDFETLECTLIPNLQNLWGQLIFDLKGDPQSLRKAVDLLFLSLEDQSYLAEDLLQTGCVGFLSREDADGFRILFEGMTRQQEEHPGGTTLGPESAMLLDRLNRKSALIMFFLKKLNKQNNEEGLVPNGPFPLKYDVEWLHPLESAYQKVKKKFQAIVDLEEQKAEDIEKRIKTLLEKVIPLYYRFSPSLKGLHHLIPEEQKSRCLSFFLSLAKQAVRYRSGFEDRLARASSVALEEVFRRIGLEDLPLEGLKDGDFWDLITAVYPRGSRKLAPLILRLEKSDPESAEEIKRRSFVFEDLIMLDDRAIQRLLREIAMDELTLALKGVDEEVQDKVFRNMSHRAAEMLREDMEYQGPVRKGDIHYVQEKIVEIIFQLEESGEIVIARGDDGDELVF